MILRGSLERHGRLFVLLLVENDALAFGFVSLRVLLGQRLGLLQDHVLELKRCGLVGSGKLLSCSRIDLV